MKRSQYLFIGVFVGLLALIGWWWQQRYQAEADNLETIINAIQSEEKRKTLEATLAGLDVLFAENPMRLDSITDQGNTIVDVIDVGDLPESKSIQWNKGVDDTPRIEMHWPQGLDTSRLDPEKNENYQIKLKLDSNQATGTVDTTVKFDFVLSELSESPENKRDFMAKIGDSLGIQLTLLQTKDDLVTVEDTLGKWLINMSGASFSRDLVAKKSFVKLTANQDIIVIEEYRGYLFSRIWPELLAGLLLLLGMVAFYYLVRQDWSRQEALLLQKDRFIANVAHELKTPIATVGVALEALQHFGADSDPVRRKEYTVIARTELDRLELLSERALRTIQLDAGGITLRKEPIELKSLVEKAWSSLAVKYSLSAQDLCYVEVQKERDLKVAASSLVANSNQLTGDPELLLHLVYNLLDNACKYGGQSPKIEVTISTDGRFIEIADHGPGIPDAQKHKVFEKFYRFDQDKGHAVKGHGLGLSYARQIVEAHGGRISVRDRVEGGSVFRVDF